MMPGGVLSHRVSFRFNFVITSEHGQKPRLKKRVAIFFIANMETLRLFYDRPNTCKSISKFSIAMP